MSAPLWQREFPDFPVDGMPTPMPAGFEDASWLNDACPSFDNDAAGLRLWVNYPNPRDREIEGSSRFILCRTDANGEQVEDLFETEIWIDMIGRIANEVAKLTAPKPEAEWSMQVTVHLQVAVKATDFDAACAAAEEAVLERLNEGPFSGAFIAAKGGHKAGEVA